jgi:PAS domain-containing protein
MLILMGYCPRSLFNLVISTNEKLKKNTTFQSQILDIIRESIAVTDAEGKIVFWNKASEKTYG